MKLVLDERRLELLQIRRRTRERGSNSIGKIGRDLDELPGEPRFLESSRAGSRPPSL
jgi:hypothetical protein